MNFARIAVSLIPVLVFLGALVALDSYKLVKKRDVAQALLAGCFSALTSYYVNRIVVGSLDIELSVFTVALAPLIEEMLKSAWIIYLIRKHRIGFMVDGAIYGFAVGAGFALVENLYYLHEIADTSALLWLVRGFGTALMHGGATAMFAVITQFLFESRPARKMRYIAPGLLFAAALHATYNAFILPPFISMLALLFLQPTILAIIFHYSERGLQTWLAGGIDGELELHQIITGGDISETHVGKYLITLKERFPGTVVADMLCYLRTHLELSLAAKGFLMMREAGHETEVDEGIRAQFAEMKYLEKNIGPIGKRAIVPLLQTSPRDLWQMYMLRE